MRPSPAGALRFAAVVALAALSLPGVRAARAGSDLVPPAKQLFAFDAPAASSAPAQPAPSCGGDPTRLLRSASARRQLALARIAERVGATPGADARVLNGRGYGYPVLRDPSVELARIQEEARRLRAEQPAH